jgi:hypothetical protein
MSDELKNAFVPLNDKDGNVTGIMDQMTANYFASEAPDPTQASIDALLSGITRVRIVPFANYLQGATEQRTLLDTSDVVALESFRSCFAIVEDPETFGHCMCCGDPHLELYAGDQRVATFGYHHGFAIRWDVWKHDAYLKEPERLLDWMSAHGVHGPRQEVESSRERGEASRRNTERWLAAMPESLRPFWERMDHQRDPELHRVLLEALCAAVPAAQAQALCLFEWFGSGAGPWSGYPSYETVPNLLLLYYPTQLLIDTLRAGTPSERQWLGAARYFASWDFRKAKKEDRSLLPSDLKRWLIESARSTGLSDNIERAEIAFGS